MSLLSKSLLLKSNSLIVGHLYFPKVLFSSSLPLCKATAEASNSQENSQEWLLHKFNFASTKKSRFKVAEELTKNEIYNSGGLIALNKPYGMRISSLMQSSSKKSSPHGSAFEHMPNFDQILPFLNDIYGKKLSIITSAERWSSGVILLSSSQLITEKTQKCFRRSLAMSLKRKRFLVVTIGSPNPSNTEKKIAITTTTTKDKSKIPIIATGNFSKNKLKEREIRILPVKQSLLSSSQELSLINIEAHNTHNHLLRIWMARCYAPILGDFLFGGRVKNILGEKTIVSPQSAASFKPPNIPAKVFKLLQIPKESAEVIPCHVHLERITLTQFFGKEGDLIIRAPLPDYFKWTCNQFGLEIPNLDT